MYPRYVTRTIDSRSLFSVLSPGFFPATRRSTKAHAAPRVSVMHTSSPAASCASQSILCSIQQRIPSTARLIVCPRYATRTMSSRSVFGVLSLGAFPATCLSTRAQAAPKVPVLHITSPAALRAFPFYLSRFKKMRHSLAFHTLKHMPSIPNANNKTLFLLQRLQLRRLPCNAPVHQSARRSQIPRPAHFFPRDIACLPNKSIPIPTSSSPSHTHNREASIHMLPARFLNRSMLHRVRSSSSSPALPAQRRFSSVERRASNQPQPHLRNRTLYS